MSGWYGEGLRRALSGQLDVRAANVKWMLLASTYVYDPDHATVQQLVEVQSGAGYAGGYGGSGRKPVSLPTVTYDPSGNVVLFDAANPIWLALDNVDTASAMALICEQGGDDAVSFPVLFMDSGGFPYTPVGRDFMADLATTGPGRLTA